MAAQPFSWRAFVIPLCVVSLVVNGVFGYMLFSKEGETTKVLGVVDGDTIVLSEKVRVRLRYVDAPEIEYCGGVQAKETLAKFVVNKKVRIVNQIPDQYGRAMAEVYVGNTLINKEMLASGWVRYHHDSTEVAKALKELADKVKAEGVGLFGECQAKVNTKNPKCIIKGNIDDATHTRRYYTPDCAQYAFTVVEKDVGEEWFCTEAQARKKGYEKAATCK